VDVCPFFRVGDERNVGIHSRHGGESFAQRKALDLLLTTPHKAHTVVEGEVLSTFTHDVERLLYFVEHTQAVAHGTKLGVELQCRDAGRRVLTKARANVQVKNVQVAHGHSSV